MKNNKIFYLSIVLLTLLAIFFTYFYYSFTFSRHSFVGELVKVKEKTIVFATDTGEEITVNAQPILLPLLQENNRYFVVIYSNKLRTPFIKKIEPSVPKE